MSDSKYSFTQKEFLSCTGHKKDAQYLSNRFKTLLEEIKSNEIFEQAFYDFRGYVARTWNQGSKRYRDYIWLGFAHERYKRPQDEVQFQVSIAKDSLSIELFVDQAALETRIKVKQNIEKNIEAFLRQLKELSNCYIGYSGAYHFQRECKRLSDQDLNNILQHIGERRIHFFVSTELSRNEAVMKSNQIVAEILYIWLQYKPLYDLIELKRENETPDLPETPLTDNKHITQNIERQFPSKGFDIDETEAAATERESRQIIYETNWLAQEKANSNHRKAVMILARHIKSRGVKPMQSVIDVFAENNGGIFIFEAKTIHVGNFIHQTRTAIGQLLHYEYFQIKIKPENKEKEIQRGILYNKKPAQKIIGFLRSIKFSVFWVEDRKIAGDIESMTELKEFLTA